MVVAGINFMLSFIQVDSIILNVLYHKSVCYDETRGVDTVARALEGIGQGLPAPPILIKIIRVCFPSFSLVLDSVL